MFMSNKIILSLIIPTYNEAANVRALVKALTQVLDEQATLQKHYELIFVDDNSPDRTWEVAQKLRSEFPQVRVIRRLHERGLSSAVIAGMAAAVGDFFIVMDADLQHDEKIIPQLWDALQNKGYDIAVGSRRVGEGSYGEFSFMRKLASRWATLVTRLLLRVSVRDPMSGFFGIRREIYEQKLGQLNPIGFKILLEFLGHSPEAKIAEVAYKFRNRLHGTTKLSGSIIRNFFISLCNLYFGYYVSSRFLLYVIVGFSGIFVNLIGFALGQEVLALPHIYTGFLSSWDPIWLSVPFGVELSVISNYILNNRITFYEQRRQGWVANCRGFAIFQLVSLLGLLIQWSIFQMLYGERFLQSFITEPYLQYLYNLIAIMIATVSNYYLNLNYTWRSNSESAN